MKSGLKTKEMRFSYMVIGKICYDDDLGFLFWYGNIISDYVCLMPNDYRIIGLFIFTKTLAIV